MQLHKWRFLRLIPSPLPFYRERSLRVPCAQLPRRSWSAPIPSAELSACFSFYFEIFTQRRLLLTDNRHDLGVPRALLAR